MPETSRPEPVSASMRRAKADARSAHVTIGQVREDTAGRVTIDCSCGMSLTNGPDWTVDEHIRLLYELSTEMFARLVELGAVPDIPPTFLYYLLTGAGPTIFVLAPECRRLAGFDPLEPDAVETHADAVIELLFGSVSRPSR